MKKASGTLERFWARVDKTDGCWSWMGRKDREGYGRFDAGGQNKLAHRFAYEAMIGEIPRDLTIDHLCRNRECVNPTHMEPVTSEENVRRAASNPGRTHCINGHERTPENRYRRPGLSYCKPCNRIYAARWRQMRRLKQNAGSK
jgi:hypothetical protein